MVKYWRHSSLDSRTVMEEKNCILLTKNQVSGDMFGLLTKCEVKMAGYWPSSFLRVYGPRLRLGP